MVQYQILGKDLNKIFDFYHNFFTGDNYIIVSKDIEVKLLNVPNPVAEKSMDSFRKIFWYDGERHYVEFEDEESALYYALKYDLTLSINTI